MSPRARKEFTRILENQLAALEASAQGDKQELLATDLRQEISALLDGSHISPWPIGAPGMTGESLAPDREQLAALYCPGIVRTELQQKNRGFNFGD